MEKESKIQDEINNILHDVLPNFAIKNGIEYRYSSDIRTSDVILFRMKIYDISFIVEPGIINAYVYLVKSYSHLLMFNFAILLGDIHDWLDRGHFARLRKFIEENKRVYMDNYERLANNELFSKLSPAIVSLTDGLDYEDKKKIQNVINEGALMGML